MTLKRAIETVFARKVIITESGGSIRIIGDFNEVEVFAVKHFVNGFIFAHKSETIRLYVGEEHAHDKAV